MRLLILVGAILGSITWIATAAIWVSTSEIRYEYQPFRTVLIDRVFANREPNVSYTIYYQDAAYSQDPISPLRHETYPEWNQLQGVQVLIKKDITAPYAEFFRGYRTPWLWYQDKESSRLMVIIYLPDSSYLGGGTHTYGKWSTSQIQELK